MREEHRFQFAAGDIAKAARDEHDYHEGRAIYWADEYSKAAKTVQDTAGVKLVEQQVTGGTRMEVVVDYGDVAAYRRMGEAWQKMQEHQADMRRFETEGALYGSQDGGRVYELSADDVHYFRLAGDPRPE